MSSGGASELVLVFCRKLRRYFLGLLGSGLCDKIAILRDILSYIYFKMPLFHIHVDTAMKSFISVTFMYAAGGKVLLFMGTEKWKTNVGYHASYW